VFQGRTMEQLNRRTTETKTTPIFTTNWYLYKTHLHPIYAKPQEQNNGTKTNSYGAKRKNNGSPKINIHQKTTNFEELLIQSIDEGLSVIGESAKKSSLRIFRKNIQNEQTRHTTQN
jgi:hypothetical protein